MKPDDADAGRGGASIAELENPYKAERERLGAVNLRADDELAEVEASGDKLVAERDDLTEAIRSSAAGDRQPQPGRPRAADRGLRCRQRYFNELFSTLFEGGTAELQLIEMRRSARSRARASRASARQEAADFDAAFGRRAGADGDGADLRGVPDQPVADLRARRGRRAARRLQRRAFLRSAGRDAQAPDTRFVTITHNPITMARMDRLFGVTMAERGVSQIVSVDLARAERFLEVG